MSHPEPPRAPEPAPVRSGSPSGRPGVQALRDELEADIRRIDSENSEIDLLMEQVLVEIERHETRRGKVEQRISELGTSASPDADQLMEARDSLLALTRRELLFDAQRQVLEGKQRILARFLQRLVEIDNSLASMAGGTVRPAPEATSGLRALSAASAGRGTPDDSRPATALRSQEDLRRDIVRQLHDGPAQSIANIGLQAEIVERLMQKGDARASDEVEILQQLVQQALDTTKSFIFEIRPMVLDDLGLGPTIRRIASDRGRRSGINVDFGSHGIEARIDSDIESAVYRSIDEAIDGFLALKPPSVLVRLDWSPRELVATVEGTWPRVTPDGQSEASAAAAARSADTPPALLAMMEEKRSADREADRVSRSLAPEQVSLIDERARAVGMRLTMRDGGQVMELVAPIAG